MQLKYMMIRSIRKELRGNAVRKCIGGTVVEQTVVEETKYLGVNR